MSSVPVPETVCGTSPGSIGVVLPETVKEYFFRRSAAERFEDRSPINTDWLLGTFAKGTAQDAADAQEEE